MPQNLQCHGKKVIFPILRIRFDAKAHDSDKEFPLTHRLTLHIKQNNLILLKTKNHDTISSTSAILDVDIAG